MKVTYLSAETGNFGVLRVPVDLLQEKGHQGGQAHDRLVALILALLWKNTIGHNMRSMTKKVVRHFDKTCAAFKVGTS